MTAVPGHLIKLLRENRTHPRFLERTRSVNEVWRVAHIIGEDRGSGVFVDVVPKFHADMNLTSMTRRDPRIWLETHSSLSRKGYYLARTIIFLS